MANPQETGSQQPESSWSVIKEYAEGSASSYFQLLSLYGNRDPKLTKKAATRELLSRVFKRIRGIRLVDYFNYTDQHDLIPATPFMPSSNGRWNAYEALAFTGDQDPTIPDNDTLKAATVRVLQESQQKEDLYMRNLMEGSEPIQDLISVIGQIYGFKKPSTRKYTYPEAESFARSEMVKKYGEGFVQDFSTNPFSRREFQGLLEWYQQAEYPPQNKNPLTISEAQKLLEETGARHTGLLVGDILEAGIPLSYHTIDPEDLALHKLSSSAISRLKFSFDQETGGVGCFLDGVQIRIANLRSPMRNDFRVFPVGIKYIMDEYLESQNKLTPEQIRFFAEAHSRINLTLAISYLTFHLGAVSLEIKDQSILKYLDEYPEFEKDALILKNIADHPSSLLDTNLMRFSTPYRQLNIDKTKLQERPQELLLNFIKWQTLLSATESEPLTSLKGEDQNKEAGKLNTEPIKQLMTAMKGVLAAPFIIPRLLKGSARKEIPHYWSMASKFFPEMKHLPLLALARFFKPDFIVTGNPWKHMRPLSQMHDLSTYPSHWKLPFEPYKLKNGSNQVYIRTRKLASTGLDPDGKVVGRIYAPEYSRLQTLQIWAAKNKLTEKDYQIEYEGRTGHYRLVFTETGKERLEASNGQISYIAGIDAKRLADGAPELVESLDITQTNRAIEFSAMLRDRGFTVISEKLEKLIHEKEQEGQPVTTTDLERSLKQGSLYAFSMPPGTNNEEAFMLDKDNFAYMPSPSEDGYAQVQCAHAAQLYSEMLNFIYQNEKFYPSTLLTATYSGLGIVFAGGIVAHSDTRGTHAGTRIIHDTQPNIAAGYIKEKIARMRRPEKSQAEILTDLLIVSTKGEFEDRVQSITKQYFDRVTKEVPKKAGKVDSNYQFPKAVVELGSIFNDLETNSGSLLDDVDKRNEVMQKLERAREDWLLSLKTYTERSERAAHEKLFGSYVEHAPAFVGFINNILNMLKSF